MSQESAPIILENSHLNMAFDRQGRIISLKNKTTGKEFRTIRAIFRNRIRFYFFKYGLKTLLSVANAMGTLVVLIVGGYLVIQGKTTIGIIVAFVSGFERISGPLRDLLNFYREYEQAKVQLQMIVKWVKGEQSA